MVDQASWWYKDSLRLLRIESFNSHSDHLFFDLQNIHTLPRTDLWPNLIFFKAYTFIQILAALVILRFCPQILYAIGILLHQTGFDL